MCNRIQDILPLLCVRWFNSIFVIEGNHLNRHLQYPINWIKMPPRIKKKTSEANIIGQARIDNLQIHYKIFH